MRLVALLRGVSPVSAKMVDVRAAFVRAGMTEVTTVLSSGNVVFEDPLQRELSVLREWLEAEVERSLRRSFPMVLIEQRALQQLLGKDPYRSHGVGAEQKRVVSFLRGPAAPRAPLPLERGGARVLSCEGSLAFTAYTPSDEGPIFMTLIEQAFGREVTTRTWDTVRRIARTTSLSA